MPGKRRHETDQTIVRSNKRRRTKPTIPRSLLSFPVGGFPKSKMVRLRYCQEIFLNAPSGATDYHTFSANGMYDPDITGTGHQPFGFDQNMAFYDHFTVLKSRCTARYTNSNGGNATPAYFLITLSDSPIQPSSYTSISHLLESPFAPDEVKQIGSERNYIGWNPVEERVFDAKKFFRRKDPLDDTTLQGRESANPTEQAYFQVIVGSIGTNDPAGMPILVTIDYWAMLTEPKLVTSS
uniref:Putative capsid protein n=1 Tax=uncultured virus TaxID=340016 RepID=A0A2H4YQ27_9VIRU|nr:putative capsid protein [uncultured virus]